MIKLLFNANTYFWVYINGKTVHFWDDKNGKIWGGPIQLFPKCEDNIKRIINSRNKIPLDMIQFAVPNDAELAEWSNAKDEEEVYRIILFDLSKSCGKPLKEIRE